MMYRLTFKTLLASFALVSSSVIGQTLERSEVWIEPLQFTQDGAFRGCGLQFHLLEESQAARRSYVSMSLSFRLDFQQGAILKTYWAGLQAKAANPIELRPLDKTWTRQKPAKPLSVTLRRDGDNRSKLDAVELVDALNFALEALEAKSELQVGITAPQASNERIFYGIPRVKSQDKATFMDCMDEFTSSLKSSTEK